MVDRTLSEREVESIVREDMRGQADGRQREWLLANVDRWWACLVGMDTEVESRLSRSRTKEAEGNAVVAEELDWRRRAEGFQRHLRRKMAEVRNLREDRVHRLEETIREAIDLLDAGDDLDAADQLRAALL